MISNKESPERDGRSVTTTLPGGGVFRLEGEVAGARAASLVLARGEIRTPCFIPVGTLGTVKSLTPEELKEAGVQILLANAYHLHLRPGTEVLEDSDGLHRFMNWDRPILTDSGGFQVFSLARINEIDDDGVTFQTEVIIDSRPSYQ